MFRPDTGTGALASRARIRPRIFDLVAVMCAVCYLSTASRSGELQEVYIAHAETSSSIAYLPLVFVGSWDACFVQDSEDRKADGVVDASAWTRYRSDGLPIARAEDDDADGNDDRALQWVFDQETRLVLKTVDAPVDGRPDQATRYYYSRNGFLALVTVDDDGDGAVDRRTGFDRDESGKLLIRTRYGRSLTRPEEVETFTYDDVGRLTTWRSLDADGWCRFEYTFTAVDARTSVIKEDIQCDGSVERVITQTRDDRGRLISYRVGGDTGAVVFEYVYRSDGNLVEMRMYVGGSLEQRWLYEYDAHSRRVAEQQLNGVGDDVLVSYDYGAGCPPDTQHDGWSQVQPE